MTGYTAQQIRDAEAPLLAAGVPLMARAATALAGVISERRPASVLLLVGSGDNGGDALFAGAELAASGIDVAILRTGDRVHEAGLAAALAAGARLTNRVEVVDVTVDGILGIGTTTALRGRARDVVAGLLPIVGYVVAVDVPSGINPDTGEVTDATILTANVTVTFGGIKSGLLREPASRYAGEVRLVDIGLELPVR